MLAAIYTLESILAKPKIRAHRIKLENWNILAQRKIFTTSIDSLVYWGINVMMYWCIDTFLQSKI